MIRPAEPHDIPAFLSLAESTGVFKPLEIETLREVLDAYFESEAHDGHVCVAFDAGARPSGFAYYAPTPMTDRTWELWWIVVGKSEQAHGIGSRLLERAESDIRERRGRILLIETSALPHYAATRQFYLKRGYEQEARVRDYYSDGDDLTVYRKRLD
jgi:GNAT superfamily N-acetyltransferase